MITMNSRTRHAGRRTEGQADRQTDEHHGSSATIRFMNASRAKNN